MLQSIAVLLQMQITKPISFSSALQHSLTNHTLQSLRVTVRHGVSIGLSFLLHSKRNDNTLNQFHYILMQPCLYQGSRRRIHYTFLGEEQSDQGDIHPQWVRYMYCQLLFVWIMNRRLFVSWPFTLFTITQLPTHVLLLVWYSMLALLGCGLNRWCPLIARLLGANMGPIWGRQDPYGPHVGPTKFVIWVWYGNTLNERSGNSTNNYLSSAVVNIGKHTYRKTTVGSYLHEKHLMCYVYIAQEDKKGSMIYQYA